MKEVTQQIEHVILSVDFFAENKYARSYTPSSLCLLFFLFSCLGWIWEVLLHIIETGTFLNKGVLAGPWLPLYGISGILILLFFKKISSRPITLFCFIMLIRGCLEYCSSFLLETLFGVRWWDYNDMLFHIQGRISLEILLVFGVTGLFTAYVAAPKLDDLFTYLSPHVRKILCHLLLLAFAINIICFCFVNVN